jgi:hypothetical protein
MTSGVSRVILASVGTVAAAGLSAALPAAAAAPSVTPVPVTGGTGFPLNAIAMF